MRDLFYPPKPPKPPKASFVHRTFALTHEQKAEQRIAPKPGSLDDWLKKKCKS